MQESKIDFDKLPGKILVVSNYVALVGGYADDKEEHKDHDVLVRDDRLSDSLRLEIKRAMAAADEGNDKIHFIANPQGPQGDSIPIYDLILARHEKEAKEEVPEEYGTKETAQEADKLPKEGEESGAERLDFMKEKPYIVPGEFRAWRHWRGIAEDDVTKPELALFRSGKTASVHIDLRLNWGKDYLEGFTLFTPGNAELKNDKLFSRNGNEKIACVLKQKQSKVWNDRAKLHNRIFEPGEVGNVAGKDTYGKMFLVCQGKFLPCRIRNEKGRRYYELALQFEGYPKLNGLWAVSEEAAATLEGIGMLMFKLETREPFHIRHAKEKKYEGEIAGMPDWQKPEQAQIDKLLQ